MRKVIFWMMVVCFVMMTAVAYGANPAHVEQLKKTKKCPNCDLTKANLSGADLTNAILNGANLNDANLNHADLTGAQLFPVVNLNGANLEEANLSGVNLSFDNLYGANLTKAKLSRATLTNAGLIKANLSGADLSGANLSGAVLSGANLSGADLTNAILTGAKLTGADLTNATWTDGKKCEPGSIGKCLREKCFGAIGNGCDGAGDKGVGDWFVPPGEKKPDGSVIQWVAVGSILHDNCCIDHPDDGQHCKGFNGEQDKWKDDKPCVKEWRKAVYNSRDVRKWQQKFGPYNEKNVSDDLTKKAARKTELTDHYNTKKYEYKGYETVSTRKLKAPTGTSLDYSDKAFCDSGAFQTFNDWGKTTDKHWSVGIGDWGVCK